MIEVSDGSGAGIVAELFATLLDPGLEQRREKREHNPSPQLRRAGRPDSRTGWTRSYVAVRRWLEYASRSFSMGRV